MFIEWWNALGLASQIFYVIAIPSTLILIVQTILMFIGMGGEADIDGEVPDDIPDDLPDDAPDVDLPDDADISGLEGLRIFTVRGIVAFFVVFSWVGIVLDKANAHIAVTLSVATVCGFLMMLALAFLTRLVMKLRNDGNIDNKNALGTSGKVYLTIPAARKGEGKVQIMIQGSFVERNAVTDDKEPIETGSEVVVIGVSGQTDLVVRRK